MSDSEEEVAPEHVTHDYATQTSIAVNTNEGENANQNAGGEEGEAAADADTAKHENITEEQDDVVATEEGGNEDGPVEDKQQEEADATVDNEAPTEQEAVAETEKADEEEGVIAASSEEKVAAETAADGKEGSGEKLDEDAPAVEDTGAGEQKESAEQEAEDEMDDQPPVEVEETVGEMVEGKAGEQPQKEAGEQPEGETGKQPEGETGEQPHETTEEPPQEGTGEKPDEGAEQPQEPADDHKPQEQAQEQPAGEQPEEQPQEQPEEQPAAEIQDAVEKTMVKQSSPELQASPPKSLLHVQEIKDDDDDEEEEEEEEKELAVHAPDQSDYYKDATATVKFVLMPSGQVATQRCRLNETLGELKEQFSEELKIPASMILLLYNGKNIANEMTLAGLGVGPTAMVQLEMQSSDPINNPIKQFPPRQEYHMPDVITVRVQAEDGLNYKDVVVEIERCMKHKPFLGGFRHRVTGSEFHNASAQTQKKPKPATGKVLYCRDTQTVEERHLMQQTTNDMSTQMTKVGIYISKETDKLLVPQKYTTADEREKFILDQVVMLQKYYRRWLARKYVQKVRLDTEHRLEWERQEELRKKNEKEERIRREFERRMNPKTREDFDLLYHALEKWRQEEVENINRTLEGADRKAALCQLLEQETELIASIGRHKIDSDAENRVLRIQRFLSKAAAPKRWKGFDGRHMEMMTPYSIRAEELREIYNSINMKYLTQDERLDVLLTLKHTVKEHDCKLTQDIIELIDREADLLMRGVRETNLDGLRRRISTLFLQYLKTPTFNPRIAKLLKVPQDPSVLRQNIYFCPSCEQYLQSTEFQLSSNSRVVGNCRRCNKIDNDARVRQDYSHYRFMLRQLRREEEAYGDGSKIAFLMQEKDLRYLVENVWNSQSILSAWEDLYDLVLVRWDRFTEWSPWNCILLTKEEASAHNQLTSLTEAYGSTFMHNVEHKHTLARSYFSRLPGMAELLRRACEKKAQAHEQSVQGKGLITKSARSSKPAKAY